MIRQECDAAVKVGKQINPIYIGRIEAKGILENPFYLLASITATVEAHDYVYTMDTGKHYRMFSRPEEYMEMTDREVEKIKSKQKIFFGVGGVLDLFNDAGIVRVMTEDYEMINKASTETIEMFENLRFSGPKKSMPVYYRRGDVIYIEGMNDSEIFEKNFIVDIVQYQSATGAMAISDLILPSVIDRVIQRGKLQMYGSTQDVMNDGEDNKQPVYHTAIQNPSKEQ
jgi:hypothetical protein